MFWGEISCKYSDYKKLQLQVFIWRNSELHIEDSKIQNSGHT